MPTHKIDKLSIINFSLPHAIGCTFNKSVPDTKNTAVITELADVCCQTAIPSDRTK